MRLRLGQDYKLDDPKTFAATILAKWGKMDIASVLTDAQTMLSEIYDFIGKFVHQKGRLTVPAPTIENAPLIIQYLQAVSSISTALSTLFTTEQLASTNPDTYNAIAMMLMYLDKWYTAPNSELRSYIKLCELAEVNTFSTQVATEAFAAGNLDSPHIKAAVRYWAIQEAYKPTSPNYTKFAIIRERYNPDGTLKSGEVVKELTLQEKEAAVIADFTKFKVDIQAGNSVNVAKTLATVTPNTQSSSLPKILLIGGAAAIGAYFMFKG
jgi:hypothetical protein